MLRGIAKYILVFSLLPLSFAGYAKVFKNYAYDAVGNIISIKQSDSSLAIYSFFPTAGPADSIVTIHGNLFSNAADQNSVAFNSIPAPILSATETTLIVRVPESATTGPVSVTVQSETVYSENDFIVADEGGGPVIYDFSPKCGIAGTEVQVFGHAFDPGETATLVGIGTSITMPKAVTTDGLVFAVPAGASTGRVRVVTPLGETTSSNVFFVPPSGSGATCANATQGAITLEVDRQKEISLQAGERIAIAVDVKANELFSVLLSEITITNPSNGYLGYYLYDHQGNMIKNALISAKAATVPLTVPKSDGIHFLVLTPAVANSQAAFNVTLVRDQIIQADGLPITIKTNTPGQLLRLGFSADQNQSLGIGISQGIYEKTSSASTTVSVLGPDGKSYQSNSYTGSSSFCAPNPGQPVQCDFNLPILNQEGIYSLLIAPPNDNTLTEGIVTLSDNVIDSLQVGQNYSLELLSQGQDGWLSFDATAGQNITVSFSNISMLPTNSRIQGKIFKPDGGYLKDYYANQGASAYSFTLTNLPATGAYRLWVSPYLGATVTATITLQ